MEVEAKDEAQIKTLRQAVHFWKNPNTPSSRQACENYIITKLEA
jgi:hypothetical protein